VSETLAITPGEPAGIGPELVVALAGHARDAPLVVIADANLLVERARLLGVSLSIDDKLDTPTLAAGCLTVQHVALETHSIPGQLDVANSGYVLETLTVAANGCRSGRFRGVVTGPVQKSVINESGVAFSGHTEFFRDHAGVREVLMLLVADELRVGLATTHLPLAKVAASINQEILRRRLTLLLDGLRASFGIARPRVLVAGLNPHAGEGGHLGREEIEVIEPVCEEFRANGEQVQGPLPADTLFTPSYLAQADAVFAMYHDQGLPVLKHVGFGRAVNVTLGLGYVRTSVDHGTALDLAGTGKADVGSLQQAIALACRLN
jgi:4-hydroxythreonine-4-phosphate dehydrogenase